MNPLEKSHEIARAVNSDTLTLFNTFGSSDNPNGEITTAYRNASRALRVALAEQDKLNAVADVMRSLRQNVRRTVKSVLQDAQILGANSARRQMIAYDINAAKPDLPDELAYKVQGALSSVLAKIDAQSAQVMAVEVGGLDDAIIFGDDSHAGVLKPSDAIKSATFWTASLLWDAWGWTASQRLSGSSAFQRQVVAAIDQKTTDCCLHAHGQIQPLDGKFYLVGTPRYADFLERPPFHDYCRTSLAIYLKEYDDGITPKLLSSSNQVLDERKSGINKVRRPSDAFS